jgi:hypothetical protein
MLSTNLALLRLEEFAQESRNSVGIGDIERFDVKEQVCWACFRLARQCGLCRLE